MIDEYFCRWIELLQRVDSCTRDGKDIQSIVLESMRKSESQTTFAFQEMHIVKNQSLLKQVRSCMLYLSLGNTQRLDAVWSYYNSTMPNDMK